MSGLACAASAVAGSVVQASKSAEVSLLVTGGLEVAADGSLHSYQLDDAAKLPPAIIDLIAKSASGWHFKPVVQAGRAVAAKARLTLRIVASPRSNGDYLLSIHGAQFGRDAADCAGLVYDHHGQPRYPVDAIHARAGAIVYLALRVDPQGHVADAAAVQVNLKALGPERIMVDMRKLFADASVKAGKAWTFKVPPDITPPAGGYWTVRVPINYTFGDDISADASGPRWQAYIPGPQQPVPWAQPDTLAASDIDAMPAQGLYNPRGALTLVSGIDHR